MRIERPIRIALVLLAMQLPAFSAEIAVLRNGFSLRFERKEQAGEVTRLYTKTGLIELPTSEIASFEPDDTPEVVTPAAVNPVTLQPSQPAAATNQPAAVTVQPAAATNRSSTAKRVTPPSRAELDEMVREASSRNRLDPDFVNSVIKAESNFQTRAVSRKGAQGLMQLMPGTAAQLGVKDAFDAKANVDAGTAHLSALLDQYHDDALKALAAYNAGAHRVDQYHGVPPYRETQAYIASIVRDYNAKKRAQMKSQAAANHTKTPGTKTSVKKASVKKAVPVKSQAATVKPQKPA